MHQGRGHVEYISKKGQAHFGHSDSEVLRAGQGREETNIHMEGRYIYR
jgi:hypothetical protein